MQLEHERLSWTKSIPWLRIPIYVSSFFSKILKNYGRYYGIRWKGWQILLLHEMLSRSLFCLCGSLPTPPNKTLTYGVASHVFCDYFRIGTMLAYNCCANFYHIMAVCYQAKCLNASRANYLKSITKLHHHIHKCLVHLIEHTLFGKLSTSMARNTQRRVLLFLSSN